jgi:hypothetical protein
VQAPEGAQSGAEKKKTISEPRGVTRGRGHRLADLHDGGHLAIACDQLS